MGYNWSCRRCGYVVWSRTKSAARDAICSHLFDHNEQALYKDGYRTGWNCPRCGATTSKHEREDAVWSFKRHLFGHVDHQVRSEANVTDTIGRTGNALVVSGPNSADADDARIHFTDPCDVVILVTTAVEERLRLLAERRSAWPKRTIVLTTERQPLASVDDLDLRNVALEIVQLDRELGLDGIGETISRVISEHNSPGERISLGFDILPELLEQNKLDTLFTFLHLLTGRIESADAFAHFYCDLEARSGPTVNLLSELFDYRVSVGEDRFVLEP